MAKKAASSKKKTSSRSKPGGARRTTGRRKASEPETVAEATAPVGGVPAAADARPSAAPAEKPTRRRSNRRKREQPATAASETTAVVAEAETIVEPAKGPSVEERDGQIVLRFPPAAPPPFPPATPRPRAVEPPLPAVAPQEPPVAAAPEPLVEPPPPREPDAKPRDHDRRHHHRDRDGRGRPGDRRPPPREQRPERKPQAPAPPARAAADAETAELTPSQRRRLRRKRARAKRQGDQAPPPPQARPARGSPPPPARTATESPQPPVEAKFEPVVEDPTPWFEAAEAIKAGLAEAQAPGTPEAELAEPLPPPPPPPPAPEPAAAAEPAAGKDKRRRRRRGRRSRHEAPETEAETTPTAAPAAKGIVREMVINAVPREECRIAILANSRLEEIYIERATAENHVGNIYKGVVTNVEPSIQAAFIDFGQGKNGFLHISDLHPKYFPSGSQHTENVGHKMPRRSRPPIQRCLRRGQEVIVQVTKEGIGTKGPTLSTYLSIPGRYLVMMPGMGRIGVSRRIEDEGARDHLRAALAEMELPDEMGFIARTAAVDRTKRELQSDLTYLTRLWKAVETRTREEPAPAELYRESDLVIRTIRDVFTADIERIMVDDPEVAERARDFLSIFSPRSADIVTAYGDPVPMFHKYGIEAELERLHSRRVPLRSGGYLVIEPTEALVAIDVNSGRFRTEDDAEATAYKINLEAADEIARQLRLRDLGGVIICDFIDMRMESHRRDIERRLSRNLKDHKERAKVLRTSQFGIIELTRQRQRASLTRTVYQDCRHCRGTGLVKTVESVALDVMRMVQLAVTRPDIHVIELAVSPDVAYLLQNRKRRLIHELETRNRRIISIRPDPAFSLDQVEIRCTDPRGRLVPHM